MEPPAAKRKKTSEIWNFFDPVGTNQAICKLCKSKFSFTGSISNLKKHMGRKHPTVSLPAATVELPATSNEDRTNVITEETPIVIEFSQSQPVELPDTDSHTARLLPSVMFPSTITSKTTTDVTVPLYTLPSKKKQTPITSFVPKKITPSDKNKIDLAILKLFAWDFQPFSMVEDRGFKNLMETCCPSYKIPGRKYFSNSMMPAIFEETRTTLKHTLEKEATSVCLTTDIWTSSKNDSYMGITGHYITEDFSMKTVLFQCSVFEETHTAKNLADEIFSAINEWDIKNKVSMIVSDNCSNITSAVTKVLKMKHYGCYAHKLNLLVQQSLHPVEDLIKKVKTIVSHFKRSNKASQKLIKYQELQGAKQPKRILQDIATRWNSTFYMLQRFVDLEEAIKYSLAILDTDLTPLSSDEWEICKQLCDVLRPCEEVTKEMSSEKYLNASKVIPITRGLKSALKKISVNVNKESVKDVLNSMLKSCDDRFPNLEKSKTLRLCTFLDPRYKHHMFLEESTTIEIKKDLCDLLVGVINQKRNEQNPEDLSDSEVEPDQETESTEKKISVWDDVEEIIAKVKPKSNPTSMAIQEVINYDFFTFSKITKVTFVTPFVHFRLNDTTYILFTFCIPRKLVH